MCAQHMQKPSLLGRFLATGFLEVALKLLKKFLYEPLHFHYDIICNVRASSANYNEYKQ